MSDQTTIAAAEHKPRFKLPSAYTILFGLIVVMAALTWIIPAGAYELDKAGAPIPGSYHQVDGQPQRVLIDSLTAPINGLYGIENAEGNISYYNEGALFGAIDVALFIIVIGGFLGVTMQTGAIQAGIGRLVEKLRGRERWMIPILMFVFALGGSTYGMAEESLAFYVLVVSVLIAAGYDAMTGAAVVLLGCGIGTLGSTINPFATGIASGFADTSISDGFLARLIIFIAGLAIGIFFVMRYADRVKRDPSRSIVYSMKAANEEHFSVKAEDTSIVMSSRQKLVLVLFGLAFLMMMYGVIPWADMGIGIPTLFWWFPEMTALFILFSVVIGMVGRMSETELTDSFVNGARDLLGVALIIGIARGITVVMNNGGVTDTVLHWAEQAVDGVGAVGFAIVAFLLFLPLSFLIPSSSGLATVAMPIMAPLAAFVGVQADLVVTAFQSANGLMNLFIPTSAVVMGGLAIARVPYGTYLRWVWPLLAMLGGLCLLVLGAGAVLA